MAHVPVSIKPESPATRTGPPRSLSFAHVRPDLSSTPSYLNDPYEPLADGKAIGTDFRGPLEKVQHPQFSPLKQETLFLASSHNGVLIGKSDSNVRIPTRPALTRTAELHNNSVLFSNESNSGKKWAKLRSFLANKKGNIPPEPSVITSNAVNITDELITGGLSTLMLKLWFERDEKDLRRIPILLHRLRIRVSDSLHPMHGHKSVFRIECEYANGAARWVVYRQFWDFWLLHTHYAVSNVYNRKVENLPDFPKSISSLHYYKFLKKERGEKVSKADFARLQRESLETYFINLIRAVMFHPSANRLCTFLEISSVFLTLARSNGSQLKAGFLKVESSGNASPQFGRKSVSRSEQMTRRWCIVSDSYLVAMEGPGELDVWDVFLLDSEFRIERAKRYYRRGFDLLFPHDQLRNSISPETRHSSPNNDLRVSFTGWVSRAFHPFQVDTEAEGRNKPNEDVNISASSSAANLRSPTALLDPSTNTNPLQDDADKGREGDKQQAHQRLLTPGDVSKHAFYIVNSQMRLELVAKTKRQMLQFITALEKAATTSPYAGNHRFGSFAPVRLNVSAQWLVDGRDYFWNLSRAISLAKETIYIHDWWLSPEVLLRRPKKEKYRLDNLLQRKARQGVKIYIILYQEVSNKATPTDSNHAKQRLINLHDNIMIQRSPSHLQTGTLYWAHHEKLCLIDKTIAFMGGLDLCFGRWDTPQHVLSDDVADTERQEIWPGKDYSNPRVSDFYGLDKPEEDMYDRTKVPRMPWHDVGMQVIGQPARDLARHFIQRWNFLLRIKNHTKKLPFLLPPPDFRPGELDKLCLTGTCELQICRSGGPWSLGTPASVEHSIQTAYLEAIQRSEHFVYIENQFFITSTIINGAKIENRIADTIVHRIIRAHKEQKSWKCCVMIPLLPGFTHPVDHSDASAVRIILECQNKSICRGPNSIFVRLRKEGINPDDYISFFALRTWGKMRGDVLTTEQIYIHSKICIVDDRLVIIGSANINERSQRGDRDSELAAVIRDTDMIEGSMAGQPFKVGRFAHTLRVRLMQEHLGIDVDSLGEDDLMIRKPTERYYEQKAWDPDNEQTTHIETCEEKINLGNVAAESRGSAEHKFRTGEKSTLFDIAQCLQNSGSLRMPPCQSTEDQHVNGKRLQSVHSETCTRPSLARNSNEQVLGGTVKSSRFGEDVEEGSGTSNGNFGSASLDGPNKLSAMQSSAGGTEEAGRKVWTLQTKKLNICAEDFYDPISDRFWNDIWSAGAARNTEIFHKVFHAIPDNHVTTWKQYKEYVAHYERLNHVSSASHSPSETGQVPLDTGNQCSLLQDLKVRCVDVAPTTGQGRADGPSGLEPLIEEEPQTLQDSKKTEPFQPWEKEQMEKLLGEVNGHLVCYPTKFLEAEDCANNFLFNTDRLLPLPLYV